MACGEEAASIFRMKRITFGLFDKTFDKKLV